MICHSSLAPRAKDILRNLLIEQNHLICHLKKNEKEKKSHSKTRASFASNKSEFNPKNIEPEVLTRFLSHLQISKSEERDRINLTW